jgi:hypothetical protein
MEMYLAAVPVYTIMLIGRLSSDALLRYIRKQVEQFSKDVAQKMLTHRSFRTIPDIAPQVVSNEDPRQRNHRDNARTRRNIGRDAMRLDGCSYRPSLISTNQPTMRKQLMEEASSSRSLKGVGRG